LGCTDGFWCVCRNYHVRLNAWHVSVPVRCICVAPNANRHIYDVFCTSSSQVRPSTLITADTSSFSVVRRVQSVRQPSRLICLAPRCIHSVSRTVHVTCMPTWAPKVYMQYPTAVWALRHNQLYYECVRLVWGIRRLDSTACIAVHCESKCGFGSEQ